MSTSRAENREIVGTRHPRLIGQRRAKPLSERVTKLETVVYFFLGTIAIAVFSVAGFIYAHWEQICALLEGLNKIIEHGS